MTKILGNTVVFVFLYIVFMIPTYILPYFGSNSAVFIAGWASSGHLAQVPQFLMHIGAFIILMILTLFRGSFVNRNWLLIFPILAAVFDFIPVLSSIPLIPTVMHLLAIILGVTGVKVNIQTQPSYVNGNKFNTESSSNSSLKVTTGYPVEKFEESKKSSVEAGEDKTKTIPEVKSTPVIQPIVRKIADAPKLTPKIANILNNTGETEQHPSTKSEVNYPAGILKWTILITTIVIGLFGYLAYHLYESKKEILQLRADKETQENILQQTTSKPTEVQQEKEVLKSTQEHSVTFVQGTLNGNKISIASGVRVRAAPQTNASEIARLPIGTIVQELERSADKERIGQSEDYWYRIAASGEIQGWVFGSLIAPFDPARREEIYWQIAAERLKATDTTFGDQVDLANFFKRAANESTRPDIMAELELGYLLALRRSLGLIPFDKSGQPPFKFWLDAQSKQILYHELGGIWIVNSDQFWTLHKKYHTLPVGERIAWEGAINSLLGECEGYLPCILERINLTEGKYLAYYPKGNHAEEALTAISDSLQVDINYKLSSEERSSIHKEVDKIRAVVLKTSSARKAMVLQQLDRLNKL